MEHNPYAPTKAALNERSSADDGADSVDGKRIASRWRRFTNLIIDDIVFYLIIGALAAVLLARAGTQGMQGYLLGTSFVGRWLLFAGIRLGYYLLCEATTSRTIGKLVSGTRVVTESGGKPTFVQVVQRTLSRLVPFEPFSFFAPLPGWHDRWSKTRVILVR
jgi:uncharacterized RDD family membrane protein YckC